MNLTFNPAKSEFGCAQVSFLRHTMGQGEVKPIAAKVEDILQFPISKNKKELMRFLGMAGYYWRFCKNFSAIVEQLTNLLHKHREFQLSSESETEFQKVKGILTHHPVLVAPDFTKPFKLAVDASDIGAGAVLLQDDDRGLIIQCVISQRRLLMPKKGTAQLNNFCCVHHVITNYIST